MRKCSNYGQSITAADVILKLKLEEILNIAHLKLDVWSGVAEKSQPKPTVKTEPCDVDQMETEIQSPITSAEIPYQMAENVSSRICEEIHSR